VTILFSVVEEPKAGVIADDEEEKALLRYHDSPAEHWRYSRTTSPIESPFELVRARTDPTKGADRGRRG
jgi:transposase-like protein